MYTYIHIYTYTYTHIHIHIYTYTYTHIRIYIHILYPPTPAASRGSASEEALLATRGEKRNFAGPVLRALLFGCGGGAV